LVQLHLANQRLIPGVNLSLKLSGVGATSPQYDKLKRERVELHIPLDTQGVPN